MERTKVQGILYVFGNTEERWFNPIVTPFVLVLLYALVERVGVSRMRDFSQEVVLRCPNVTDYRPKCWTNSGLPESFLWGHVRPHHIGPKADAGNTAQGPHSNPSEGACGVGVSANLMKTCTYFGCVTIARKTTVCFCKFVGPQHSGIQFHTAQRGRGWFFSSSGGGGLWLYPFFLL